MGLTPLTRNRSLKKRHEVREGRRPQQPARERGEPPRYLSSEAGHASVPGQVDPLASALVVLRLFTDIGFPLGYEEPDGFPCAFRDNITVARSTRADRRRTNPPGIRHA